MKEHNIVSRRSFIATGASVAAVVALAGVAGSPKTAFADPASDKQAEAQAAKDKLNTIQHKLDVASNDYYEAQEEQKAAQARMDEAQGRIDETNARIQEVQTQLGTRVRSMYRTGSSSFIDLLLGATTYTAFTNNWNLLNDMNDSDTKMVEESKELKAQVEEEKATYAEQEKVAARKANEAEKVKNEAEGLVAEAQATYDSLSAEAAALLEQQRQAEEAAEMERAAATDPNNGGGGGTTPPSGGGGTTTSKPSSGGGGGGNPSHSADPGTVVGRAYAELGKPYVWAGVGPAGYDCSGFVSYCLTGRHVRIGSTGTFMGWPRVSNPVPGDVCTHSSHCGIYIGGGQMIHAPHTGDVVKVGPVQAGMIYVRY